MPYWAERPGYVWGALHVTEEWPYEHERMVEVWECSRCSAIVRDPDVHDRRCQMDADEDEPR